jgi:hypothetical protein
MSENRRASLSKVRELREVKTIGWSSLGQPSATKGFASVAVASPTTLRFRRPMSSEATQPRRRQRRPGAVPKRGLLPSAPRFLPAAADGLLEQVHRHPGRRRIGMGLRVVSRNRAAKIVLDEMLDFGSVHVGSSLSVRRPVERQSHRESMK